MSDGYRFKRYRDEESMQRDAATLSAQGWELRGWRIRGQAEDGDVAGLPPSDIGLAWAWPGGPALAAWEFLRFVLYVPIALVTWAWLAIAGRNPIEAVYRRSAE